MKLCIIIHFLLGISFAPYSKEQLQQLLISRLGKLKLFHDDAINFCAMSVASSFGDARRVLNLAKYDINIKINILDTNE